MASNLKRTRFNSPEVEDGGDQDNEDGNGLESLGNVAKDNHAACVNEDIDTLKEVFDELTCLDMLRSYYEILSKWRQVLHLDE